MASSMNKFLTIVIPTYNREKQLIRLLKSIERQNAIDSYYIVILDNHSDYDVEASLKEQFSGYFFENIQFYHRPYNAGGDYNIGSSFLFAKSQYLWIIGDDDEVVDGCIDAIENNISRYPDMPLFKYQIKGNARYKEDIVIKNIEDFNYQYKRGYFIAGDVIFMSNNIFNLPALGEYISTALYYSYCSIPHAIPMLRCMADERPFLWSHHEIIKYNAPEGDHWNFLKIATSFSTILDINIPGKYNVTQDFFKIISNHFEIWEFLYECLKIKDKGYRKYVVNKGLLSLFEKKSLTDILYYIFYKIEILSKVPFLSNIIKTKKKIDKYKDSLRDSNSLIYRMYKKIRRR